MPTIRRIPQEVEDAADMTDEMMRDYCAASQTVVQEEREAFAFRSFLQGGAIAVLFLAGVSIVGLFAALYLSKG